MDNINPRWRHELDHDTESMFWLLLYWVVCTQPEEKESKEEYIDNQIWSSLMGQAMNRILLIRSRTLNCATHSVYKPLCPLLNKLAGILDVDRHWLESSDPRNDPGYLNEAFQRLILKFILDNRDQTFMKRKVSGRLRHLDRISESPSLSHTSNLMIYGENIRIRSTSDPSILQGDMKRPRINAMADRMISEVSRRCTRWDPYLFLAMCFQVLPGGDEPMEEVEE
jgi:hypothetical protein